jgi:long-chain acyl-CoA synthetase
MDTDLILECAVVGVPDQRLGEEVGLVVVAKRGIKLDVAAMVDMVKGNLAKFKVPALHRIVVSEETLPRGDTGKTLKKQIRVDIVKILEARNAKSKL